VEPVICNPLDLPYRYQDMTVPGFLRVVCREGADPSLLRFRGRYYLFVSMGGGFWHSPDLASWEFVATPGLPIQDYAPDVREVDGALVFTASHHGTPCSFWRTADPLSAEFEELPGTFPFWDPNLFQDDDGRVYLYWGCSNDQPVRGVEVDRRTLRPLGEPVALISGDDRHHGWERFGEADGVAAPSGISPFDGSHMAPFIEGAWMTKHDGVYYLQYAAPGTEFNTYADGYYTAGHPLGPFTYSPHNPYSSLPGGFAPGAGHGSTVQDEYGNWWHVATSRISVHHPFERRIGIYPAGFDADGALFCNQQFGDHPMVVPQERVDPWTGVGSGWRLLSYGRPATATSALADHGPELVTNEDIRNWWVAAGSGVGEGITVDLGEGCTVWAVQVNLADHDIAGAKPAPDLGPDPAPGMTRFIEALDQPVPYRVEVSDDGATWATVFADDGRDSPHRLIVLDHLTPARHVRVTGGPGAWGSPLAIGGVRVFGERAGEPPARPAVQAVRVDELSARVTWTADTHADGANVRYGSAPDKLYHSWLVYGRNDLLLPTLSAGVDYWVAVDAFNGSGITSGEVVQVSSD
jgi:hypothetical protein